MSSNPYPNLSDTWSASARYTASGQTDVAVSNPSDSFLFWSETDDDTEPTTAVRKTNPIGPKQTRAWTLPDGKRLWLGGKGAYANVED